MTSTLLISGSLVGIIFGFLLQRGSVADFNTIVGQFLFKNFTVLKIMLTAIIVGGILIHALVYAGYLEALPYKASSMIGSAVGGVIFGIGMATLGYCPGTALAALGSGARDALFGIAGMVVGTIIFEHLYLWLQKNILVDVPTTATLATVTHLSPWIIFVILSGILFAMHHILMRWAK